MADADPRLLLAGAERATAGSFDGAESRPVCLADRSLGDTRDCSPRAYQWSARGTRCTADRCGPPGAGRAEWGRACQRGPTHKASGPVVAAVLLSLGKHCVARLSREGIQWKGGRKGGWLLRAADLLWHEALRLSEPPACTVAVWYSPHARSFCIHCSWCTVLRVFAGSYGVASRHRHENTRDRLAKSLPVL